MLKAVRLSKYFGSEPVFTGVDLVLNDGDRVGLVGPNGAGKSTLLRVLAGQESPSGGHLERTPGTTVGYFAQQVPDPEGTVDSFLRAGLGPVEAVSRHLHDLEQRLSTGDTEPLTEYGEVQQNWADLRGWTVESRLAEVRDRLDIAHLPDKARLGQISGGEQARLTLAQVLLGQPDVLILDEPTNHLDADGIAWLAGWLARPDRSRTAFPGAVLVVSHDRAFLDATVDRIVELDGIHDEPQTYAGGYTDYRAERERRWQRYLLDYEAQEKKRVRWEADIAATKEHARGVEVDNPRAPGLRRIARKVARKAIVRERRLRRQLDSARWLAAPEQRPPLTLAFPGRSDPDTVVVEVRDLTVTAGPLVLLDHLNLTVQGGERIRLTGRNGSGKTSLLRTLAAADPALRLLPQTHDALRTGVTVLDYFRSQVPVYVDDAEALLTAYQFGDDQWGAALRSLSAGELRRLLLAVMVNSGAEVLLLDEPTNYLDVDSLDVVEAALRAYEGTLLMVTHDAYFADQVGVTRLWHLADGVLTDTDLPVGAAAVSAGQTLE